MKKISILFMIFVLIFAASSCSGGNKGVIFNTEYEIEDYCEDAIIVSKTDGKVYGLLNNNGKEIVPLNYDDLDFMNKENYCNGYDDTLYLNAEYEGEEIILDTKGKEILRTSNGIYCIDLELKGEKTDNTPFFYECAGDNYKIYNEKGKLLSEIPDENNAQIRIRWISDKAYCTYNIISNGFTVYDYNGKKIGEMDSYLKYTFPKDGKMYGFVFNLKAINATYNDNMKLISIDQNGKIKTEKDFGDDQDAYLKEYENMSKENTIATKKYYLYQSNGTWKLEDADGKSLYEERYFERLDPNGENDCIALTNEDNQICIIGRDGAKYVDYGALEYAKEDEEINFISGEEKIQLEKGIFEGKNSLIIPVKGETGYDIYFYKGK